MKLNKDLKKKKKIRPSASPYSRKAIEGNQMIHFLALHKELTPERERAESEKKRDEMRERGGNSESVRVRKKKGGGGW